MTIRPADARQSIRQELALCLSTLFAMAFATSAFGDHIRELQTNAVNSGQAQWGHWGTDASTYANWGSHSNRLIPIYSFGMSLDDVSGENSVYRSPEKIKKLYGRVTESTLNPDAEYFDQTDVYRLQKMAVQAGKKRIILFVFDGMDWQTTQAAAIANGGDVYTKGRGQGLHFQDYRGVATDYGFLVTSPHNTGTKADVDKQTVKNPGGTGRGGYSARMGGRFPWSKPLDPLYPIAKSRDFPDVYTDSASAATAMTNGTKSYNNSVNVSPTGEVEVPIGRWLQPQGYAIGVVSSVPISHATPAAAWANNVHRGDYQDLTRDLLGRPSISHPDKPLPGVDVLLGCGWGVEDSKGSGQGANFVKGNKYLAASDLHAIDVRNGGRYVIAQRSPGKVGSELLAKAAENAAEKRRSLFGFFGVTAGGGHLPYQTADGAFDTTVSAKASGTSFSPRAAETYSKADIRENPTLGQMTSAALTVLSAKSDRFWLMVEAGDVDWANHANNIDNSIGAVLSGNAAFRAVTDWVEANGGWSDTVVLLTADHGHYLVLDKPEALVKD